MHVKRSIYTDSERDALDGCSRWNRRTLNYINLHNSLIGCHHSICCDCCRRTRANFNDLIVPTRPSRSACRSNRRARSALSDERRPRSPSPDDRRACRRCGRRSRSRCTRTDRPSRRSRSCRPCSSSISAGSSRSCVRVLAAFVLVGSPEHKVECRKCTLDLKVTGFESVYEHLKSQKKVSN